MVSAICAAPMVLGGLGILRGKRATCYPGFEEKLEGVYGNLGLLEGLKATCYPGFEKMLETADYTGALVTVDGNITTGEGPAAAFPYAYSLLALLVSEEKATEVAEGMRYIHLMEARML